MAEWESFDLNEKIDFLKNISLERYPDYSLAELYAHMFGLVVAHLTDEQLNHCIKHQMLWGKK